jgi:hypothetical protein
LVGGEMDEDLWSEYDHQTGREVILRKTDPNQYELILGWDVGGISLSWDMSRKGLRDLFHAIQGEIGPCSCSSAMIEEQKCTEKS